MIRNIFLIFCEGANTEPEYFKAFPVNTETHIEAIGLGMSRTALINRIIGLCRERAILEGQRNFDPERQIWSIFDRDDSGIAGEAEDFDSSIMLAAEHGLRVAYSNDCFELWLRLHDHFLDVQHSRQQHYDYLSDCLKINYNHIGKGKDFSRSLYELYLGRQPIAIRNSHRLSQIHKEEPRPSRRNPYTTVYELVKELNKCLKR